MLSVFSFRVKLLGDSGFETRLLERIRNTLNLARQGPRISGYTSMNVSDTIDLPTGLRYRRH